MIQQQRNRRRRIPVVPPSATDTPPARRAYCPECGEVQRDYGNWQALFGSAVVPHMRAVVPDTAGRRRWAEKTTEILCPGGTVDPVKDRAP